MKALTVWLELLFSIMLRLTLLYIFGITFHSFSQNIEFPVDDSGKYTISEVVDLPGMNKDQLFINGEKFMKKVKVLNSRKKYLVADKENYQIANKGSFYVYRLGSIKKGIAGAVEYDLILEFKDDKYRYTISNYLFNEYQKNRYGKYEPVKGKYTPLEVEVSSLNRKEWEKQRTVVYEKSQELIMNLSEQMIYSEEKKSKKAKKDQDW